MCLGSMGGFSDRTSQTQDWAGEAGRDQGSCAVIGQQYLHEFDVTAGGQEGAAMWTKARARRDSVRS